MNDIFDIYSTDPTLEESGVWVQLSENAKIKVKAFNNKEHQKVLDKLRKPYQAQIRRGTLDSKIEEDIYTKSVAKAVLVDWEGDGIVDPDTKTLLPYSYENAYKLLSDPRLKRFKGEIVNLSLEQETFRVQQEEETVKNSKKSSSGN